jgi:adenine phosphoribosyltransferase
VPLRKKGKLPARVIGQDYALEYGVDTIEVHADAIKPGDRVLLIDDLIATGGTVEAACELIEEAGATVAGVFAVVALPFLDFNTKLRDRKITYLQEYNTE